MPMITAMTAEKRIAINRSLKEWKKRKAGKDIGVGVVLCVNIVIGCIGLLLGIR